MRISIVIAVVAVVVLAAGGGYYGLEVYPQQQFRAGLDQALTTLGPDVTASYKDAHYSVMSHQAVVTGLVMHRLIPSMHAGDPPQKLDVTFGSIESTGPNLDFAAAFAKAQANPDGVAPDTVLPVADALIFKDVTVQSPLIAVTTQSIRIAKPRLYPRTLLHDGLPAWNAFRAAPTAVPSAGLEGLAPFARMEAAMMMGIAYDGYETGAMKVTETLPEITVEFDIRQTTSGGFDRGVMKAATAEGIAGHTDKTGSFAVDRVSLGESDMREPMTRIASGEALSQAMLNGLRIGRVEYTGLTVQPPGQPAIRLGGFSIGPLAFAQGLPVMGQMTLRDFGVSKAQIPDAKGKDAFDKLGLETMTISFALSYDWDVAQKHLSVHDTMLKVNELGLLTLTADLTNVEPNVATLRQAQLTHAKLRFDDASLVDRLLKIGAAESGADPAAFRQQVVVMARSNPTIAMNPALTGIGQTAGDFITAPHSLTVELSPPTPVPVMAIQGMAAAPAGLVSGLGLKVSANQP